MLHQARSASLLDYMIRMLSFFNALLYKRKVVSEQSFDFRFCTSAGDAHSAALTSNGFLFMWGSNEKGQLGLPAAADVAAQASVCPLCSCVHRLLKQYCVCAHVLACADIRIHNMT